MNYILVHKIVVENLILSTQVLCKSNKVGGRGGENLKLQRGGGMNDLLQKQA